MLTDIETLELKTARHDSHRFETKLDVCVTPFKKTIYKIETYFFIPKGLNINPVTYKKSDFYDNIQNNIRYKTPHMYLKDLTDPNNQKSPLNRLNEYLSGAFNDELKERIIYELKMLGSVSKEILKDYCDIFAKKIKTEGSEAENEYLSFLKDLTGIISKIETLRKKFFSLKTGAETQEAFTFFDDFFSLNIIEYLSVFLSSATEVNISQNLRNEITAIIKNQISHRNTSGYKNPPVTPAQGEYMMYRRSVLKKFIASALFLNIKTLEFTPLYQIMLGFAAAAAMLFTVVVLLIAQSRFAVNSFPFVVVLVVSYIFKDRIKDWLKLWFTSGWTGWIYDRKRKIYDATSGNPLGVIKEAFSFVEKAKLPPQIIARRMVESLGSVYEQGKPESVIRYEKKVVLHNPRTSDARKKDINDIMRFNIYGFLGQADDPLAKHLYYDEKTGKVNQIDFLRTYHINVIMKYTFLAEKTSHTGYERLRVVVTRDGILRLEEVPL